MDAKKMDANINFFIIDKKAQDN